MAAKHFFEKRQGKRFRPTIVQLVAKMCAAAEVEDCREGLHDWENSGASDVGCDLDGSAVNAQNHQNSEVWRRQGQLGQVTEMIHVASLIHDDVLDYELRETNHAPTNTQLSNPSVDPSPSSLNTSHHITAHNRRGRDSPRWPSCPQTVLEQGCRPCRRLFVGPGLRPFSSLREHCRGADHGDCPGVSRCW